MFLFVYDKELIWFISVVAHGILCISTTFFYLGYGLLQHLNYSFCSSITSWMIRWYTCALDPIVDPKSWDEDHAWAIVIDYFSWQNLL